MDTPDPDHAQVRALLSQVLTSTDPGACVDPVEAEKLYHRFLAIYEGLERQNTSLAQTARELRETEAHLWALYENAPVAYLTFDADLAIRETNHAFRTLLDQGLGTRRTLTDYLEPESREVFLAHVRSLAGPVTRGTCTVAAPGYAGVRKLKLESNVWEPGGVREYRTILTDITPDEEAEQALRASESRFKAVVEHATEGMMIMDDQARILVWNSTLEDLSGYSSEEVVGTHIWDMQYRLAPPEKRIPEALGRLKVFNLGYIQALKAGAAPQVHENRLYRPDGTYRTIQFTINFLQTGAETLFVTMFRDITEAKTLEAELVQAKKMEAVGLLVGGTAHDFNNFLGAIFGRLELANLRPGLGPELKADLAKIEKSARNAAAMTRKLLVYARKDPTAAEVVNLNEVLGDLVPNLRRQVPSGVELVFEPSAQTLAVPLGRDQVDQIVTNLCLNARDAIPGAGTIRVSTTLGPMGNQVLLEVGDTGVGMDPATAARIFEPFFTTKKLGAGTGLGLATVQGIVYKNQGEIRVDSRPGEGTRFTVVLPRYQGPLAPLPAEIPVPDPVTVPSRILVVEDEPEILGFVTASLGASGHTVRSAPSAEDALALLGEGPLDLDLLVTDVMLPGKNGRDLAREILDRSPAVKVLFISGFSGDILAREGLVTPEQGFLAKPFTLAELRTQVARQLAD